MTFPSASLARRMGAVACMGALALGVMLFMAAPAAEVDQPSKQQGESPAARRQVRAKAKVAAVPPQQVQSLVAQVRVKAKASGLPPEQIEAVIDRLRHLEASNAKDAEFLLNTRDFAAGKVRASMYQAYLKTALGPLWQRPLKYLQREVKAGNHIAEIWLAWADAVGQDPMPKGKFEWTGLPEAHRPFWEAAHKIIGSHRFRGDPKEAGDLLLAAVKAGEPRAQAMFAQLLATGAMHHLRTQKDTTAALAMARQAAAKGDLQGMQVTAWLHSYGPAAMRDAKKAVELARRAADRGYLPSKVLLGWMYLGGIGVKTDAQKARQIAAACAASGHPYAKALLIYCLQNGIGGPKKLDQAFAIAHQLAKAGDGTGMLNLGNAYYYGWGVARDKAAAVEWWKLAGQAGLPAGYQAAGRAYLTGDGVRQSKGTAWVMLTLAQVQNADQPQVEAWAQKYRKARKLNTHQWLRKVRAVRVTGASMTSNRTNKQAQHSAEIAVLHRGLKLDPDASVELNVRSGIFAVEDSKYNMAWALSEFRIHVPVLMRGEFINTRVTVQYGFSAHSVQKNLRRVVLGNQVAQAVNDSIDAAMDIKAEVEGADAPMDPRFKKELWPVSQDRKMYIKYQVAQAFRRESGGSPLAGFTTFSDAEIRLVGGAKVGKFKLRTEWEKGLEPYGLQRDRDAPYYISYDVLKQAIFGFFDPTANLLCYAAIRKRNVVIPLPDGRLARTTVGLYSDMWVKRLLEDVDLEHEVILQVKKFCEEVGPAIQKSVKAPLTPNIVAQRPRGQR